MEITILLYLIKTCLCSTVFAVMYKFILRNETFHRTNRFILLTSIVASLLLPAISWDLTGMDVTETVLDRTQEATALLNNIVVKPTMHNKNTFLRLSTAEIILALFFTGVACICVKNASTILHIKRIITRSKKSVTQNGKRLYISREKTPSFSWMGKIVVSEDDIALDCNRYIVWHEEAHASLGHYIDLAITEVFVCILWFWPSAWVLKRYLKEVHEYEADKLVLATEGCDAKAYQMLMIKKAAGSTLYNTVSGFNYTSLKKRITMINKKDSGRWALAKSLCLIPAVGTAICLATCIGNDESKGTKDNTEAKDTTTVDNIEVETTVSLLGSTKNTTADKSLVLAEYPGGIEGLMRFLGSNIKYPQKALDNGVEGQVLVEFVIDRDGSVCDVKPKHRIDPLLDDEAVRAVKNMPKWKPGTKDGKNVRIKYILPVSFRLQK